MGKRMHGEKPHILSPLVPTFSVGIFITANNLLEPESRSINNNCKWCHWPDCLCWVEEERAAEQAVIDGA